MLLKEVKRLQKLAGIIKEGTNRSSVTLYITNPETGDDIEVNAYYSAYSEPETRDNPGYSSVELEDYHTMNGEETPSWLTDDMVQDALDRSDEVEYEDDEYGGYDEDEAMGRYKDLDENQYEYNDEADINGLPRDFDGLQFDKDDADPNFPDNSLESPDDVEYSDQLSDDEYELYFGTSRD